MALGGRGNAPDVRGRKNNATDLFWRNWSSFNVGTIFLHDHVDLHDTGKALLMV